MLKTEIHENEFEFHIPEFIFKMIKISNVFASVLKTTHDVLLEANYPDV